MLLSENSWSHNSTQSRVAQLGQRALLALLRVLTWGWWGRGQLPSQVMSSACCWTLSGNECMGFSSRKLFHFWKKKKKDKGNNILHTHTHTHTHRGDHGGGAAQIPLSPESLPWSPELEVTAPHTPYKWELVSRQIFSLVSTYQCQQLNRKFRKGGTDGPTLSVRPIVCCAAIYPLWGSNTYQ